MIVQSGHRRGVVLIWVVLLLLVFIGMGGLALDTGFAVFAGQQLQNTADSAALAAAQIVRIDQDEARAAAVNLAMLNEVVGEPLQLQFNGPNASGGDIVVGFYDLETETFTPTIVNPNAVRVVARRTDGSLSGPLDLFFAPMFGVRTIEIERSAIAITDGSNAPGLLVISPDRACALDMDSKASLRLVGVNLWVDSQHPSAMCVAANAHIEAPQVNVTGGARLSSNARITGEFNDGVPPIADPLVPLPAPSFSSANDLGTVSLSATQAQIISPGYYSGGISLDNNSQLTLLPGIYVLDGVGLNMRSNTQIVGNGVTLYIVDTTPTDGTPSSIDLSSNVVVNLQPPDPTIHSFPGADIYAGVSIFQARSNTNTAVFNSNAANLGGTLYFPRNHLEMDSNSVALGGRVMAWTIHLNSNARVEILNPPPLLMENGSSYLVK